MYNRSETACSGQCIVSVVTPVAAAYIVERVCVGADLQVSFVVLFLGLGVLQLGVRVGCCLLMRTLRARSVIVLSYYLAEHILGMVEYGMACF